MSLSHSLECIHNKIIKKSKQSIVLTGYFEIFSGKLSRKCGTCEGARTCDASFRHKDSLKRHLESVHERKNTFKCSNCFRSFMEKSNLKKKC